MLIHRFLKALIITIVIEAITIYFVSSFLAKKYRRKSYAIRTARDIFLLGILPSSLTLPYLWFVIPFFIVDATQRILIGELLVVVFEALLFKLLTRFNLKICLGMSFLANFTSFAIGRLLVSIFKIW